MLLRRFGIDTERSNRGSPGRRSPTQFRRFDLSVWKTDSCCPQASPKGYPRCAWAGLRFARRDRVFRSRLVGEHKDKCVVRNGGGQRSERRLERRRAVTEFR